MYRSNKPIHLSPYDHPDIYPGPRPATSFVFYKGVAHKLEEDHTSIEESMIHISETNHMYGSLVTDSSEKQSLRDFLSKVNETPIEERIPVIAYGSNVCLAQLVYKSSLNKNVSDLYICFRATIKDTDVIYGAFLAPYGSLPAIIGPVDGAEAEVWVTLLTREQVELMNRTEGGYKLRAHHGGKVLMTTEEQLQTTYAYYYPKALFLEGQYYRFNDIPGNSPLTAVWQADMLNTLREICGYEGTREEFIHLLRWDSSFRHSVKYKLDDHSKIFNHPDWEESQSLLSIREIRQNKK
ncbi:hypothetical protein [Bacillus suaedaesalsae]|uniref:Acetoacetate decarboxylase n=1 Tax=Bacillus suaedaesalsae TaxID=2810349 RepID=A0ABS2DGQ4_9BACI|nr:hypothetical protein [Bacillus suaedaesalsae]MBM6617205.1 hypothetical protein [Bacillus suaedaesalsae]